MDDDQDRGFYRVTANEVRRLIERLESGKKTLPINRKREWQRPGHVAAYIIWYLLYNLFINSLSGKYIVWRVV